MNTYDTSREELIRRTRQEFDEALAELNRVIDEIALARHSEVDPAALEHASRRYRAARLAHAKALGQTIRELSR